ncbi:two-component system sensor histidine kinase NtrB [Salaquimonas pukyongi]|uniref:two-component system sensor histidine kinase NtrB n=1 Tax=Salaquimonas pukyongi TaxID=2712698 RepID=UPI00096B6E63|nr:ATP-binding protein [Salaquimonas pukyongi]
MGARQTERANGTAILDSLPHPVLLVDADNRLRHANLASEEFLRSSVPFICRQEISYFLPFGSPVLSLIEQVRVEQSGISEYRIDVSSPRLGKEKVVDVFAAPHGEEAGWVVLQFLPKTAAEKLDRQLTHRNAARSVTGLAAMLAHEIKNPLSGIRGAAQLLEMSAGTDDRALTYLIKEETDRIVHLVDRMEVFSDERPLEKDPVNIHSVLEQVRLSAQSGFGAGVSFRELYDPSLPLVTGNRDQLIQVFLNLVKNAAESVEAADAPEITLTTGYRPGIHLSIPGAGERVGLPIEICVRDNGPGIPEDLRGGQIFDPFITTKTNGTGLGLALVAKIIGNHGGVVECDSEGEGACFRILLPVHRTDHDRTAGDRVKAGAGALQQAGHDAAPGPAKSGDIA